MHFFEEYLQQQNLEALSVSVKAGVRYMTVYNAMKGKPITPQHAQQIIKTFEVAILPKTSSRSKELYSPFIFR